MMFMLEDGDLLFPSGKFEIPHRGITCCSQLEILSENNSSSRLKTGDLLYPFGIFEEELKCMKEDMEESKYEDEDEQEKEVQKLREAHLKIVANSLYGSLSHGTSGNLFFAKGFKSN